MKKTKLKRKILSLAGLAGIISIPTAIFCSTALSSINAKNNVNVDIQKRTGERDAKSLPDSNQSVTFSSNLSSFITSNTSLLNYPLPSKYNPFRLTTTISDSGTLAGSTSRFTIPPNAHLQNFLSSDKPFSTQLKKMITI